MATPIRIKRSAVPGKRPTLADLQLGEPAINTFDGKIYLKRDTGVSTSIVLVTPWIENTGGSIYYNEGNIGVGTENPTSKLSIFGDGLFSGILTATTFSGQINAGVGTINFLTGSQLNYSGIATVASLNIGNTQVISSGRQLQNILSLDAVTTATIESAIANAPNTFTNLVVTGVSTLGVTSASNLTAQQLNVSGISTLGVTTVTRLTVQSINSSGIITASSFSGNATSATYATNSGIATYATIAGIATYSTSSGIATSIIGGIVSVTQLSVSGITTLGITTTTNLAAQQINVSGVVTASSFSGNVTSATYATIAGIATYSTSSGIATYAANSGIATYATLSGVSTNVIGGIGSITQLSVSGVTTTTRLNVGTGGTVITTTSSGLVGIGTINPRETLDVIGTIGVQASGAANRFEIQHNVSLNSLDFIFV